MKGLTQIQLQLLQEIAARSCRVAKNSNTAKALIKRGMAFWGTERPGIARMLHISDAGRKALEDVA